MRIAFIILAALFIASPAAAQDVTSNLEAHYTFNSTAADASGNARNLTAVGSITYGAGHAGNGALISGTGAFFRLTDASFLSGESSYTIAFWAKRSTRHADGIAVFLYENIPGILNVARGSLAIAPFHTSGVYSVDGARAMVNGVPRLQRSDSKPATGAWSLVAFVVESPASAKLYVHDGSTLYTSSTASDCTLPAGGLTLDVGRLQGSDIDELRVYSRALSQTDVETLAAQ